MDLSQEKFNFTRRPAIIAIIVAIIVIFIGRLFDFQVIKGAEYLEMAQRRTVRNMPVDAVRGEIYDRNGIPLAVNRTGYAIIFDKPFFPGDRQHKLQNSIILSLINLLTSTNEEWIDTLPISKDAPYSFEPGREGDISRLKDFLRLSSYASADNCMSALIEKFELQDFPQQQARQIAGVRYEMQLREFSYTTQYTFARDISISTVAKIKENSVDLPGVDIKIETFREYIDGDLAPNIIGTTGPIYSDEYAQLKEKGYALNDIVGKSGIEKAMEDYLRGKKGVRSIEQNPHGAITSVNDKEPAVAGNSVYLTIDAKLQRVALDSLKSNIERLKTTKAGSQATSGGLAVIDVRNGEVLALASYPSYDLAAYYTNYSQLASDPLSPLFDRSVRACYPPGSTFKMATAIAALESGAIEENTSFICNHVYTYFSSSGYSPKCIGWHGSENVIEALRDSCNIFFYESGRRTGIDKLNEYAALLGFGEPTGIEIPESKGILAGKKERQQRGKSWNPGDTILAAIGQSDNMFTPLQLANYVATIANGGTRYEAHLVRQITEFGSDKIVKQPEAKVAVQTGISKKTIDIVKRGMLSAAKTGTAARTFGSYAINVGAKTGSAQVPTGNANGVFVTFAPYENPEIAIAIVVEHGGSGGAIAPIAKDIYDHYFGLNRPAEQQQSSSQQPALPDASQPSSSQAQSGELQAD